MDKKINQAKNILAFLKKNIPQYPADIVNITAQHFNVTRTTVHRHLNKLLKTGEIIKTGTTRDVAYYLTSSINKTAKFSIDNKIEEFTVYDTYLKKSFARLAENVESICHYGFTEIFNNALDHSKGKTIWIALKSLKNKIKMTITDDGVGVFKTIYDFFSLDDMRESVLQLSKGKMTTLPEHHTGEGLFFSSRAFDVFEIFANNLHFLRDNKENDWALQSYNTNKFGSKIVMTIDRNAKQDLINIFKTYQDTESLNFTKTDILVQLSKFGHEKFISRSQAKRILRGLEGNFKTITLDFKNVKLVGQGFVDEIFRVYKNQHPEISFKYINANKDVEFMITRGIANSNLSKI